MRIIAGKLGGRTIDSPKNNTTHPMSDKMRGAIFSTLGDIEDLNFLDAFAGSGAVSFEAISRGADHVIAVDVEKRAISSIVDNSTRLNEKHSVKAIRANISTWSDNNESMMFDVIICDPPYDKLQIRILQKLVRHLKQGGTYVLSWPGDLEPLEFIGLKMVKSKSYGDSKLVYYRRTM